MTTTNDTVGPVLAAGEIANAIIAAIRETNANVTIQDRGSYIRVLVPHRCVVSRAAIERVLGRPFVLPGDLESAMPSFKGRLSIDTDQVVWAWR